MFFRLPTMDVVSAEFTFVHRYVLRLSTQPSTPAARNSARNSASHQCAKCSGRTMSRCDDDTAMISSSTGMENSEL